LFKRLSDVPNGFYQLQIQSLAPETTQVYVVLSEKNLQDDFENIVNITLLGVLGFFLVFFGIILMIIIGIYVIIVKIKSKKISKNS